MTTTTTAAPQTARAATTASARPSRARREEGQAGMRGDTLRVAGTSPSARPAEATRQPAPETSLPARLRSLALGGAALWAIVALGGPSAYIPLAVSAAIVVAVSLALRHTVPHIEQRVGQALAGEATAR
jgi:hypothetical protein